MIRIDDTLLEEIGLIALPKQDRDQLLRQIYETLEMRVGMRLAERMTDQQLDEFERFIDTNDEAGALKWLESNFPDYKQVVADELEKLKNEIKQDSSKIIETMQTQPQQMQQGQMPQQTPPVVQPQPPTPAPSFQPPQSPAQPPQPFTPPAPAPTPYDQNAMPRPNFGEQQTYPQPPQQDVPPPFGQDQQPPQAA